MKLLRFNIKVGDRVSPYRMPYNTEADIEWAKRHSANGEITVEEVPEPINKPTQLDAIEAQVTYTAMMTDTLLEV